MRNEDEIRKRVKHLRSQRDRTKKIGDTGNVEWYNDLIYELRWVLGEE